MGAKVTTPFRSARLGTWIARAINTVYQAPCDGFVTAEQIGMDTAIQGYTDINNPPVTVRTRDMAKSDTKEAGICMPVKKGDYWQVTSVTVPNVFWIPLENVWGL